MPGLLAVLDALPSSRRIGAAGTWMPGSSPPSCGWPATAGRASSVTQPFHRDGWVYEEKYDGWRMIASKDGTQVRLVSRTGKDHARRFSELAAAIRALPVLTLILDGEVAIFDDQLISRFEWFRMRPEDAASTPPIYMAFDCLYLEGRDLRPLPLQERRADHALLFPARQGLGAKCGRELPHPYFIT